ncbi:hypothetical protein KR093_007655, partial [Drosophila rubida]
YPSRLVTYDAEEIGEPRLIRYSDLTQSTINLLMTTMEEEDRQLEKMNRMQDSNGCEEYTLGELCDGQSEQKSQKRQSKNTYCKAPSNRVKTKSRRTRKPPNAERLKDLEIIAADLHKRFVSARAKMGKPLSKKLCDWQKLLPMQKFRYYWEALTRNELKPNPFLNFEEIFLQRYHLNYRIQLCRQHPRVMRLWRSLKCRRQLPFILNALLYQISIGTVDPYCSESVRGIIGIWS